MYRWNRKGQNTLEYVLLITAVVVAFLAVQHLLNRSLQGRVREAADNIGDQFDAQRGISLFVSERSSVTHDVTGKGAEGAGITTTATLVEEDELSLRRAAALGYDNEADVIADYPALPDMTLIGGGGGGGDDDVKGE